MKRRWLAAAAVWVGLILLVACAGNSPSGTVKAFYAAIDQGKTDEALSFVSEQTLAMISKDKLRAGLQGATRKTLAKGGLKNVEITDEKAAGDVATVTAVLKYGNGTEERETLQLVKEKGSWRLQPKK
jgi:hypothetical protein